MDEPYLYLVLGLPGSGRRGVVADLIDGGIDKNDRVAVFVSAREEPSEADQRLAQMDNVSVRSWTFAGDTLHWDDIPAEAQVVFWILDGWDPLLEQMELLHRWVDRQPLMLARILAVIHCQLDRAEEKLRIYHDACGHFADVLLLNHRDGIPNKEIAELVERYKKERLPCLLEYVKKGRVTNPPLVLEPQARRLTQMFDDMEPLEDIDIDEEGDDLPDEPFDLENKVDPWLERDPAGRLRKRLPDVRKILESHPEKS